MKNIFQIAAVCFCMLVAQAGFAADNAAPAQQGSQMKAASEQSNIQFNQEGRLARPDGHRGERSPEGYQVDGQCPADHPCDDQPTGDCYCLYCHYEPCYYTTKRCVEEKVPCTKRCCRMCKKYYEVQRCRYVPEYYNETICRDEPEYYDVEDCKVCQRWVCDQHCKYVPSYYWKHVCQNPGCENPACPNSRH